MASAAPRLHLGWWGDKSFQVDADLVVTGRTCVIGSSGSGKSYVVGVICEELCKNQVPFVIIDVEGEYSGLKEKYETIWVGDDEKCDLKWSELNGAELSAQAPDSPPLILDLSEADDPRGRVEEVLTGLYDEVSKRRTPYLVILEEADRFAPQVGERLKIFDEVARRGRKRGLGLMLCTQRPSLVDKNVLSQCGNQLIGKMSIRNDLQAVAQFFPGRGLPEQLTTLAPGAFYAIGGFSPIPVQVKIRPRETRHGGVTPKLASRVVKPSAEILAKLRGSAAEKGYLGLPPLITAENVPSMVKREKSFILLGEEEVVTDVSLTWRPLAQLGVRMRSGTVKKKVETMFFLLDGVSARRVELEDRLAFKEGFEQLLGSNAQHVEVLRTLRLDKYSSVIELAGRLGLSEDGVRKSMRFLEERRLVTPLKVGRAKIFRRLVDVPKIKMSRRWVELEKVKLSQGKLHEAKIKEAGVREIVKGLFEGSDVESFSLFYYPLYRVELLLKGKKRAVWLDGRTGKTVDLVAPW